MLTGGIFLPAHLVSCGKGPDEEYDVVVYGTTSGGIIAAIAAARKGKSVILI
ncbi:MAG: FAD-dependent oxidoreductase [Bacteroidetes bacterium]|jgi:NADPH-dependent 2,4-dienoyl-CoA reductase/sulfur reductase-like enzyme|nr:FAD-dependent oxidoreductase [Bacteroidota bacterium]